MRSSARISSTTLPAIATFVALAGFAATNVYSQHQAQAIDRYAKNIATVAAPSLRYLSDARAEVHSMQAQTGLAINLAVEGQRLDREFFDRSDARLHEELAAYLALPFIPGARGLYSGIDVATDAFERAIDRTLYQLGRGQIPEARRTMREQVFPAAARASKEIGRLIDFDAERVNELSARLTELRHRAAKISHALHALSGALAVILLVITLRALRDRMRLANEGERSAELRAKELEQFAGRVAHDLKNPLGAIALRIELARRGPMSDEFFDRLKQQLRSMNHIIDGLLGFALAAGGPQPRSRAGLPAVLEEVLASVREDAATAHAELEVAPCAPVAVACTEGALTSVLSNLLRNAIKYVGGGSGCERRIAVHVRELGPRVRVEVTDTGPGIPPAMKRAIFEPFVRVGGSVQPGLGLGLATVKRIVETCGGTVGVESVFGRGSCFWFELPKAMPELPRPPLALP